MIRRFYRNRVIDSLAYFTTPFWLRALAVLVFAYAAGIAIRYSSQPLLDMYFFRQAQTALTTFWMMRNGFSFAYETPVGGAPWSIPFEFPIYQILVATICKVAGAPLDIVGRLTSFVFLVACIWPAQAIVRRLSLSPNVTAIFACLLLSSPIYLYWGRTFMIETAATFFSFASVPFFLDTLSKRINWRSIALFSTFSALALLQKITTGLPVLVVLSLIWLIYQLRHEKRVVDIARFSNILTVSLGFGVPVLIGLAWSLYANMIISLNSLGIQLTPKALPAWYWGTLEQRLSLTILRDIFWSRLFTRNAAGLLGVGLVIGALTVPRIAHIRQIVLASLALCILPILVFINLHNIHDYYQTASAIFLIGGLAIAIGDWLPQIFKKPAVIFFVTLAVTTSNLYYFKKVYLGATRDTYSEANSREMAIANILKREIPEGQGFVAFGFDWNSALSYLSERKSLTVPLFFKEYSRAWSDPQRYLGDVPVGAIVVCPIAEGPSAEQVQERLRNEKYWRLVEVYGCSILLRAPAREKIAPPIASPIR